MAKQRYIDETSNRRFPREQEGFGRAISVAQGEILRCGTAFDAHTATVTDFRGPLPAGGDRPLGQSLATTDRRYVEWETPPPEGAETTVFTWIGGSLVRPVRRAFPYATATLSVNGKPRLDFPLGWPAAYTTSEGPWTLAGIPGSGGGASGGVRLHFEPRRFASLVEETHRTLEPDGISGFYRLELPASELTVGQPLRLRIDVNNPPPDTHASLYVSPRSDALRLSLGVLRDQLAQLQADMVRLKQATERLYTRAYPEYFPRLLRGRGERLIVHSDELLHYHPATITVLRSGVAIITAREASDHLDPNGRIVAFRSRDGGRTWGPREVLLALPGADHRCLPIFELPDGTWAGADYRAGALYHESGYFDESRSSEPTLWGVRSADEGKTWTFSPEPLTVPGFIPYGEAERHMIRLPSGRLLVAANYAPWKPDGKTPDFTRCGIGVHASDDDGRTWKLLATTPEHPLVIGEPSLLRTSGASGGTSGGAATQRVAGSGGPGGSGGGEGRIILVARTQHLDGANFVERGAMLQSVSLDEGQTWSPLEPTGMSSMASPGHLLQLRDGRILCTHASRHHPGGIYLTTSSDEGRTWDTAASKELTHDLANSDSCYPTSGQLPDGTLLTTWYENLFGKFAIVVVRYRPEEL